MFIVNLGILPSPIDLLALVSDFFAGVILCFFILVLTFSTITIYEHLRHVQGLRVVVAEGARGIPFLYSNYP